MPGFLCRPPQSGITTAGLSATDSDDAVFGGVNVPPIISSGFIITDDDVGSFPITGGSQLTESWGNNTNDTHQGTILDARLAGATSQQTTNYGTSDAIFCQSQTGGTTGNWSTLLTVDLSILQTNTQILTAALELTTKATVPSSAVTIRVYENLRTDWQNLQATGAIWKTGSSWTTVCGRGAGDLTGTFATNSGTKATMFVPASSPTETVIQSTDLAAYIQARIAAGTPSMNFNLSQTADQSQLAQFYSSEGTDGFRPRLRLVYVQPAQQSGPGATGIFRAYTDGKIYDPNGAVFIPRGCNLWSTQYTANFVNAVKSTGWGFNFLRCNYKPGDAVLGVQANVDAFVDTYTALGIVVMIDFHIIGGYSTSGQVAFFTTNAARNKNNPYVWYSSYNEPGGVDDCTTTGSGWNATSINTWTTMHNNVVNAVRAAGASAPVVCGAPVTGSDVLTNSSWSRQFTGGVNGVGTWSGIHANGAAVLANDNTLGYRNLIWDVHIYGVYANTNPAPTYLQAFIDYTKTQGQCLIFGEYGQVNGTIPALQSAKNMHPLRDGRFFGDVAWHGAGSGSDATKNWLTTVSPGGVLGTNNFTNPTNLTAEGKIAWDGIHSGDVPRLFPPGTF